MSDVEEDQVDQQAPPVGRLLRFADPELEAQFTAHFHSVASRQDYLVLLVATPLFAAAGIKPWQHGHWGAAALTAANTAYLLRSPAYQRHRSWLLILQMALFPLNCRVRAPSTFNEAWCPQPLPMYWLRELTMHLSPWIAGTSVALLLPLRQAAWAQALIVAAAAVNAEQRRRRSLALGALGGARYARLAGWATELATALLPLQQRAVAVEAQGQLPAPLAFHQVDLFLHLAISYACPLVLLRRWELRQRQAWARQRRLAAQASALVRLRREQGSWLCYTVGPALIWLLCLCLLSAVAWLATWPWPLLERLHALVPPAAACWMYRLWVGPY